MNLANASIGANVVNASSELPGCEAIHLLSDDMSEIWLSDDDIPQWLCISLQYCTLLTPQTAYHTALEIRTVGWYCWHPYLTNPKEVRLHVSRDSIKFKIWDTFFASGRKEGIQLFCCEPINIELYPYIALEIVSTFGGNQTYMNRLYLYTDEMTYASTSFTHTSISSKSSTENEEDFMTGLPSERPIDRKKQAAKKSNDQSANNASSPVFLEASIPNLSTTAIDGRRVKSKLRGHKVSSRTSTESDVELSDDSLSSAPSSSSRVGNVTNHSVGSDEGSEKLLHDYDYVYYNNPGNESTQVDDSPVIPRPPRNGFLKYTEEANEITNADYRIQPSSNLDPDLIVGRSPRRVLKSVESDNEETRIKVEKLHQALGIDTGEDEDDMCDDFNGRRLEPALHISQQNTEPTRSTTVKFYSSVTTEQYDRSPSPIVNVRYEASKLNKTEGLSDQSEPGIRRHSQLDRGSSPSKVLWGDSMEDGFAPVSGEMDYHHHFTSNNERIVDNTVEFHSHPLHSSTLRGSTSSALITKTGNTLSAVSLAPSYPQRTSWEVFNDSDTSHEQVKVDPKPPSILRRKTSPPIIFEAGHQLAHLKATPTVEVNPTPKSINFSLGSIDSNAESLISDRDSSMFLSRHHPVIDIQNRNSRQQTQEFIESLTTPISSHSTVHEVDVRQQNADVRAEKNISSLYSDAIIASGGSQTTVISSQAIESFLDKRLITVEEKCNRIVELLETQLHQYGLQPSTSKCAPSIEVPSIISPQTTKNIRDFQDSLEEEYTNTFSSTIASAIPLVSEQPSVSIAPSDIHRDMTTEPTKLPAQLTPILVDESCQTVPDLLLGTCTDHRNTKIEQGTVAMTGHELDEIEKEKGNTSIIRSNISNNSQSSSQLTREQKNAINKIMKIKNDILNSYEDDDNDTQNHISTKRSKDIDPSSVLGYERGQITDAPMRREVTDEPVVEYRSSRTERLLEEMLMDLRIKAKLSVQQTKQPKETETSYSTKPRRSNGRIEGKNLISPTTKRQSETEDFGKLVQDLQKKVLMKTIKEAQLRILERNSSY